MRFLMIPSALLTLLSGCSSTPEYDVLVTAPSGLIGEGDPGMGTSDVLKAHWTCSPAPTHWMGSDQPGDWTSVSGAENVSVLRTKASCPDDALLTVQVDGAVTSFASHPATLRCQVFDREGKPVADESVTRGLGKSDPTCRVIVKG